MSREELLALIAARAETIESLTARLDALEAENAELKRRLAQNSRNSSKPPSSDGPEHTPPPRSLRRKTGRNPGKQPGAQGFSLKLVDDPDVIVDHVPDCCRGCGNNGLDRAASVGVVRRQVTDVPAVSVTVTEHRLYQCRCACGMVTTADAPAGVADAPASYGSGLRAWVVYLLVFQHVPVARVVELVTDLTGAQPSAGWVCQVLRQTADALAEVEKTIRVLLTAAHILHVDETGTKITGARWWLHVASTDKLTTYHVDKSRGRSAITALGVLDDFDGIAVHDAWAAYDRYNCTHALCGAHIARELIAAGETHPGQYWPDQALDALFGLNTAAEDARDRGDPAIPSRAADPLLRSWRHAIAVGLSEHPHRPGRKQSKTRNLLTRLRDREDQVLRFAHDLTVPFTNNQAERDLRPSKTQIKISGTHRSEASGKAWARIRGFVSTARKHGITAYDAIRSAVTGNPWTPPLPAT
jgi:transposase